MVCITFARATVRVDVNVHMYRLSTLLCAPVDSGFCKDMCTRRHVDMRLDGSLAACSPDLYGSAYIVMAYIFMAYFCRSASVQTCGWICVQPRAGRCAGVCINMGSGMFGGMCIIIGSGMCAGRCAGLRADTCIVMREGMCADVYQVHPWAAVITGVVGALVFSFSSRALVRLHVDDVVDACAVRIFFFV